MLQMEMLRWKLEEVQADNQKLRFEGRMLVTTVARWISDQK